MTVHSRLDCMISRWYALPFFYASWDVLNDQYMLRLTLNSSGDSAFIIGRIAISLRDNIQENIITVIDSAARTFTAYKYAVDPVNYPLQIKTNRQLQICYPLTLRLGDSAEQLQVIQADYRFTLLYPDGHMRELELPGQRIEYVPSRKWRLARLWGPL